MQIANGSKNYHSVSLLSLTLISAFSALLTQNIPIIRELFWSAQKSNSFTVIPKALFPWCCGVGEWRSIIRLPWIWIIKFVQFQQTLLLQSYRKIFAKYHSVIHKHTWFSFTSNKWIFLFRHLSRAFCKKNKPFYEVESSLQERPYEPFSLLFFGWIIAQACF